MLQTLLAVSIVLSAQPAATAAGSDESQVQRAFDAYRAAVLAKDGAAAAAALDDESVHYYARARDSALNDDEETLKKEPLLFKITVLKLRRELGADQLRKLNGRELVALAVEKGWVNAGSVEKLRLGKVTVTGDQAKGESWVGEQQVPVDFMFKREGQGWRFSYMSLLAFAEPSLKELAKRLGKTEDEFILAVLEQTPGAPVTADLWKPLVSSSAGETVHAGGVVGAPGAYVAEVTPPAPARVPSRVLGALGGKAFIFKRSDGKARTFNAATTCPDVKKDDEVVFVDGNPDAECEKAAFENRRTNSVCQVVCRKLTP